MSEFSKWEPLYACCSDRLISTLNADRPRVVFDLGSNEGGYVATWLDAGATSVVCFEPVPYVREKLALRFADNPRVTVVPFAVSDKFVTIENMGIYNAWSLAEAGSRSDMALDHVGRESFDVDFVPLDEFGSDPDFVKMDVDGYEFRALRGMRRILKERRPSVMFEFSHLPKFILGDDPVAMCDFIYDMDYKAVSMKGWVCQSAEEMMRNYPEGSSYDIMLIPSEKV